MDIIVTRKHFLPNCTIGSLEVIYEDNPLCPIYLCDTLEPHAIDWSKEKKKKGKTAIPCGQYEIEYRYSTKFAQKMPYLKNVPNFNGVMIHWGNYPRDTQGCILVGHNPMPTPNIVIPRLVSSRLKFQLLEKYFFKAMNKSDELVTITIREDRRL